MDRKQSVATRKRRRRWLRENSMLMTIAQLWDAILYMHILEHYEGPRLPDEKSMDLSFIGSSTIPPA